MRRKIIIAFGVALVIVAAFIFCVFFGVLAPIAPPIWGQIHAGMTRSKVLALVGTPSQSGWPEKIAETWERSGLVSHRRLFVIYDGERIQHLWDGTWVRGFGWSHPREESL
jgi:hypothetical protein